MNVIKVKEFHEELDSFLETMAKKYSFVCKKSQITYDDFGIKITVETADVNSNGDVKVDFITEATIASALAPFATGYTKTFEHYMGLTFRSKGEVKTIIGYNTRAKKFPIELGNGVRAAPRWVADCLIENGLLKK